MKKLLRFPFMFLVVGVVAISSGPAASGADTSTLQTMAIDELLRVLKSSQPKPLMFYVGPHTLYEQAHIPDSEFLGAASLPEGQQRLRSRVEYMKKKTAIILYCGCCPWSHCPNANPAYDTLKQLGFTNVKVLYIPNNFGVDWVDKGYPTASGE